MKIKARIQEESQALKVHNHRIDAVAKGSRLNLKRVVSRGTGGCECMCPRCNREARCDATVLLSTIISMIVSIPM